jgi:sulfatase maturation enzyme AslB (radical SAM superfamily)
VPANQDEDIILIAIFMVTKDDILSCADELGMSQEQITDDVIDLVRQRIREDLRNRREVVRNIVKEAIRCPLGLVCSSSCPWREIGGCTYPTGTKPKET